MKTSSIILAGGESSRFGSDKVFYKIEGQTFISKIVGTLHPVVDEIIISVDTLEKARKIESIIEPEVKYNIDKKRGGPAVAIAESARIAESNRILVIPADLPFVSSDDIIALKHGLEKSEFSIFRIKERFTMLFFGVRKEVLGRVQNPYRAREFLWKARSCTYFQCSSQGRLLNINTPDMIPNTPPTILEIYDTKTITIPEFSEDCEGIIQEYEFWRKYSDMEEKLRKEYERCRG